AARERGTRSGRDGDDRRKAKRQCCDRARRAGWRTGPYTNGYSTRPLASLDSTSCRDGACPVLPAPSRDAATQFLNGLKVRTSSCLKSRSFLVATIRRWTRAVAAIIASSNKSAGLLCIILLHSRKQGASMGSTWWETGNPSTQRSSSLAFPGSCRRVRLIPACISTSVTAERNKF